MEVHICFLSISLCWFFFCWLYMKSKSNTLLIPKVLRKGGSFVPPTTLSHRSHFLELSFHILTKEEKLSRMNTVIFICLKKSNVVRVAFKTHADITIISQEAGASSRWVAQRNWANRGWWSLWTEDPECYVIPESCSHNFSSDFPYAKLSLSSLRALQMSTFLMLPQARKGKRVLPC